MSKVRRMFPGGNTANGFYSLHDNIISDNRNMLYILKGMPGGGKSSLMKEVGKIAMDEGFTVEFHHCPSDPNSVDGIVIFELGIGMVDGTAPHIIDPIYPGLNEKIIDLGIFIDSKILKEKDKEIINAKVNNKYAYKKAFSYLKAARVIYELIEEDNGRWIDKTRINEASKELIENIFQRKEVEYIPNGFRERHLFSSSYTPEGFVDLTNLLLESVYDVFYIEGEIGLGKSLLLNRIADEARIKNYDIEVFLNALLPDKIETIYIKNLDIIITTNKLGLDFAKTILNLNKFTDLNKLNQEDYKIFDSLIEEGVKSLNSAKENHYILEKSYRPAIDYSGVNKLRDEIFNEIFNHR